MSTIPLLLALLSAPAADPVARTPPAAVKETVNRYIKALANKDVDGMAALAGVPWIDRDRQLIRSRDGLRDAIERVMTQLPADKGGRKIDFLSYKDMRSRVEDRDERKRLDELLGEDGWIVSVEEEGYPLLERDLLVRIKDGKAVLVGGPLKPNQLSPQNVIPAEVDRLLDRADTFVLYSLDPDKRLEKGGFHGWKVLGKTEPKRKAVRKRLADALRLGAEDNFGMAAGCFIPRHGIRLVSGNKTVDLVICFQCLSVQVFVNGEARKGFLTSHDPQKVFDPVLTAAGVQLPKQAKE